MRNPHHIARIDQEDNRNFCWKLAIQRNNKQVVEYFTDGRYGGKAAALRAAKKRRDELLAVAPPPLPVKNRKTVRNKTGKVGVRFCEEADERKTNSYQYSYYVAFWTGINGKHLTIRFSTNKYGKRKAFALACIARDHETRDREWIEKKFEKSKAKTSKSSRSAIRHKPNNRL